ncbi:MAG: DUF6166 domain-containing protein [Xanthobacteraceae bacterium]
MKIYQGKRTMDGLVVTVDGEKLPEHYEVKQFTKRGFEWTYEGTSPQQLALAILFDHLGDKDRAIALSGPYMRDVIANLDNDWTISSNEIDSHLRKSGGSHIVAQK